MAIMAVVNTKMAILLIFVYFYNLGVAFLDMLNKIMALLSSQKKTQNDLTDYLGLEKGAFTKWKAGKNQSYLKYMEKISDFFSVPISYFYEDKKISLPSENDKLNAEYNEWIKKIRYKRYASLHKKKCQ